MHDEDQPTAKPLPQLEACPSCKGTGQMPGVVGDCPRCSGTGETLAAG